MRDKPLVNKKDKTVDKYGSGWEAALREAERQIQAHKRSIVQLRGAVGIFKSKIASGEPWPRPVQESDRKRKANG